MSSEFAGSLRERISIERLSPARTAMGLSTSQWEPVCRCLASIAPEGAGAEAEAMSLSAMPRYRVTIRARADVTVEQRVNWAGRRLMIRQCLHDPALKDRIMLRCEEVR